MMIQMLPLFEKGNVLTKEMLESIKNYGMDFTSLCYDGYSDGMIKGFSIDVMEQVLTIGRGMLRFHGKLYMIPGSMSVFYKPESQFTAVKLVFQGETRTENFIYQEAELKLLKEPLKQETDLEICRFKLQNGARLRKDYQNFADYNTEFDTVNEIYADWSAYEKPSIAPSILMAFAREAMTCAMPEPIDFTFCQQVLSLKGETLNRDSILLYIHKKLGSEWKEYSNFEIYEKLLEIIRKMKNERKGEASAPVRRQRFVIS